MTALSRRSVLTSVSTALGVGLLAACSEDTSGRYNTGFVAGEGVTTEIPPDQRSEAIDFTAQAYSGEEITLSAWRGAPVVLNVWYASCAPCRKEAPDLKALAEEYAPQGVRFVGINVRDTTAAAQAFEKKFEIPYPSIPDLNAEVMYELRGQVTPNAVPSTLVFDEQGRVAARISGLAEKSILSAMIDRVLSE